MCHQVLQKSVGTYAVSRGKNKRNETLQNLPPTPMHIALGGEGCMEGVLHKMLTAINKRPGTSMMNA